jgi:hypothetical protein
MKKLKQIEFNEELIGKEGIVINFRKPDDTPPEVFVSNHRKASGKENYIIAIDKRGGFHQLSEKGKFIEERDNDEDLLMYQEVEIRVFYVNEYRDAVHGYSHLYNSLEVALQYSERNNTTYIRTIKLVEEIE